MYKTIIKVFISMMVLYPTILVNAGELIDEGQIRETVNKVIGYIINNEPKMFLKMLPSEYNIMVGTDQWLKKCEIEKEFSKKGRYYLRLFDTHGFNGYRLKHYKSNRKGRVFKKMNSIRDDLIIAKMKNLRIKLIQQPYKTVELVNVILTWDGKESVDKGGSNYSLHLEKIKGKWWLVDIVIRD